MDEMKGIEGPEGKVSRDQIQVIPLCSIAHLQVSFVTVIISYLEGSHDVGGK